jgi:hypothetical protein
MLVWKQAAVMIAGSCRVRVKSAQCFLIDARYGSQVAASGVSQFVDAFAIPKAARNAE